MTPHAGRTRLVVAAEMRPWYCARCGYALLNEVEWGVHAEWHRRESVRAEYAEADAEIERELTREREA